MRNLLGVIVGVCAPSIVFAGIFSWTDPSGNVIYGDKPPQGVAAKPVTPPKLTVLENFANRYEGDEKKSITSKPVSRKKTVVKSTGPIFYKNLTVIAPKQGQAIRANDGDVSVALSLSPKLRLGDQIVFKLDGKEIKRGASKVANMTNLDRGEHTLIVSIFDKRANQLISSENVTFNVLRNIASKKHFNPYESSLSQ